MTYATGQAGTPLMQSVLGGQQRKQMSELPASGPQEPPAGRETLISARSELAPFTANFQREGSSSPARTFDALWLTQQS